MQRVIFILLSIISISSYVTEEDWLAIENQLIPKIKNGNIYYKLASVKSILNYPTYADISFYSLSGAGSYGYVFSGILGNEHKVAIKVHFEEDKYCQSCWDAYESQQAIIATGKSKYIVGMERPMVYKMFDNSESYVCVFLMEKGYVASNIMFSNKESILLNTDNMVNFVVKTVEAFAVLNFEANYYHADVKPDNIIWVYGDDGLIEPRIIDFDLSFKVTSTNFNPGHALYTHAFRSPELLNYIPGGDFAEGERAIYKQRYVLNAEYKEEAYAVGKSLSEIIKINQRFIEIQDERIIRIMLAVQKLMDGKIDSRWSTKFAFEYLVNPPVKNVVLPLLRKAGHTKNNSLPVYLAKQEVLPVLMRIPTDRKLI